MCYIKKNRDLKDLGNFDARLFLRKNFALQMRFFSHGLC